MLTAPVQTLLLLVVAVGLGAAFVWMFWEFEQASKRRQASKRKPHRYSVRPPRPPNTFSKKRIL
jgi:hypothetical protein